MLISRTPVRISLFGGGTDYPTWLNAGNKGIVFGGTINKYSYISCRHLPPFYKHKVYLSYSEIETCDKVCDVKHKVIRSVLEHFSIEDHIEISHLADIPSKTGTGSSSTFLVGLINAVARLLHFKLMPSDLYSIARNIEQNVLKECVGYQDSLWAAYGGFNSITLEGDNYCIQPMLGTNVRDFERQLMFFYTGLNRKSSDVASTYVPSLTQQADKQKETIALTHQAINFFKESKYNKVGELLDRAWSIKRSLSPVISSAFIDKLYDRAKSAGALGGKITGAGGGGSLLLYVPEDKQYYVQQELADLVRIPFKFSAQGSEVILQNGE